MRQPIASHKGPACITCRKKCRRCDRGRPFCDRCTTRGIHCAGYPEKFKFCGIASRGKLRGQKIPVSGDQRVERLHHESNSEGQSASGNDSTPSHRSEAVSRRDAGLEETNQESVNAGPTPRIIETCCSETNQTTELNHILAKEQTKLLLSHYDQVICPHQIAQTTDNLDNPYRKYILPLAYERIGLLCAVLGLSACHLGFLKNDAFLTQTVAVEYQLRAIQALGEAIEKGNRATLDENEIDTILATIQILILHDICESGISLHGVHVAGAVSILNQLVAKNGLNTVSERTALFLGNLAWLDIIRAFSGVERLCHSRGLREKVISTCDKKFEMVNGCPRAIFAIIGRAFDYAKAYSLGEIGQHDYQNELHTAKQELYMWRMDRDVYPSEDRRWQFVADAFRHACILRILRLSDQYQPVEHPEIQRSVTAILDAVAEIPSDCPLLELLVLPLFMAGADAISPFARHYVLIRIEDIKGRSHFQNPMPKDLLRKVWDARAGRDANDNRNVPWMAFTYNPALERQHDFLII